MKLDLVIKELHRSENELAHVLLRLSERHKTDHETYHVARDLVRWCHDHVRELARIGEDYGLKLDAEPAGESTVAERVREKAAEWLGRRKEPGLLLLADLRHLYRVASGVSLDWELLAQAAQGARRKELLELAERCHPQTLRQVRWANARLKESATQALVS
ncbi:hypothetical protein HTZ77_40515 [Nonomuraea sp. SMC257]|uniref:DUF892 family protein n=1 Tax=Nonomuraea montanisoli TaxID=2741721 RepID=A0A7Y6IHD2_9ACTN|nr:hypothetical protein [Nonomuraea montanisoli]NUW37645.1 hypothetical protein [Nonomuraea montanisoli]